MSNACSYAALLLSGLCCEVPQWPSFLMCARKKEDGWSLTLTIVVRARVINQMLSLQFWQISTDFTKSVFYSKKPSNHKVVALISSFTWTAQLFILHLSFHTISWHLFRQEYLGKKSNCNIFASDTLLYQNKWIFILGFLKQYKRSWLEVESGVKKNIKEL